MNRPPLVTVNANTGTYTCRVRDKQCAITDHKNDLTPFTLAHREF